MLRYTERGTGKSRYFAQADSSLDFDEARQKVEAELNRSTGLPVRNVRRASARAGGCDRLGF